MVKILHLQPELNLACGITRTISQIVSNTSEEFEHHIIALGGDGLERFDSSKTKITLLRYNKNSLFDTIKILQIIKKYIKSNSIDIVHAHHRYFDTLTWLIKKNITIKTITSVQSKVYKKKYISYKADKLIACSNFIKNHLINYYNLNDSRIKVIYNMVDLKSIISNQSKQEFCKNYNIPENKFLIGFAGRINFDEKGIDILLQAILELQKKFTNIYLVIAGNGEDQYEVEKIISQKKLNVKIINPQKNIEDFFNAIDLFVLPSRIEPFGIVILEAGKSLKPVIASNVDGIPEIVQNEENGLLFEVANVNDLKSKIISFLDDRELAKRLALNLHKRIIQSFTVEKNISIYEQVYRDVIK